MSLRLLCLFSSKTWKINGWSKHLLNGWFFGHVKSILLFCYFFPPFLYRWMWEIFICSQAASQFWLDWNFSLRIRYEFPKREFIFERRYTPMIYLTVLQYFELNWLQKINSEKIKRIKIHGIYIEFVSFLFTIERRNIQIYLFAFTINDLIRWHLTRLFLHQQLKTCCI